MALPLRDGFHVNAQLDCAGDEHPAQAPLRVVRIAEPLASVHERAVGSLNIEQPLVMPLTGAESFDQRAQLREDRYVKNLAGLFSFDHDLPGGQVDVRGRERRRQLNGNDWRVYHETTDWESVEPGLPVIEKTDSSA